MLICPQCKFNNPYSHKFCQNCGASLTVKGCPECGIDVSVSELVCQNCGAQSGTVWLAIITFSESVIMTYPSNFTQGSYLDSEQRYKLLQSILQQDDCNSGVFLVQVLDCQPHQIPPLKVILPQEKFAGAGIPDLALVYTKLQYLNQGEIPAIHDSWQQGNMEVVLMEDRSQWPYLLDLWLAKTTGSPQILQWLYQMMELWHVLAGVNCCQSLYDLSNLRVDKNGQLALVRLSPDQSNYGLLFSSPQSNPIQALGRAWQELFIQSQRTHFGCLVQVLHDLELGLISSVSDLRSRLEEVAAELEITTTTTTKGTTILQLDELEHGLTGGDEMVMTPAMPALLLSLEDAGGTDVGRLRDHNEDYFGVETKLHKRESPIGQIIEARGLYILCDGMGGHAGGEVASELAVTTLWDYFREQWQNTEIPAQDIIQEGVYLANQEIFQVNQKESRAGTKRMGTTLVMLLISDNQAAVAHVGDSRLYRCTRQRGIEQITLDHEVGQREITRGVEASIAYSRPDAYQLTQALGPRDNREVFPDVQFFNITEDTIFLLVSDGLSDNNLLENYGLTHLMPLLNSSTNLHLAVRDLIEFANQHNGHDNITAILVRAKVGASQLGKT